MFTKPIDEITFEDVESFCQQWAEGVRVEYKSDIEEVKGTIPKIVSSFANTYGGILLIGVEADQKNNTVSSIPGIPQRNGIEEQFQQSALTGIYPGVIPEIKLIDVPNSENVVVVVRVDESIQAPHAIQNSTGAYIRTGSITPPYERADMDRIVYMLKRREDSQVVARQIFKRIEERSKPIFHLKGSTLTVIAQPVFPYRPVISASDIYELHGQQALPPRRVAGGVSQINPDRLLELNEYGIVYHRTVLYDSDGQDIDYGRFLWHIEYLIGHAKNFYKKCEYLGNIEVSVQLQKVLGKRLTEPDSGTYRRKITDNIPDGPVCSDSEVLVSKRCLSRDLENEEKRRDIVEELTCQLIWAFNIPIDESWVRKQVRNRIEQRHYW